MNTFTYFLKSRSGYVKLREGLSVGWANLAIVALTFIFGMINRANATDTDCYGIPPGDYGWRCTTIACEEWKNEAHKWWHWHQAVPPYNHWCIDTGEAQCTCPG